MELALIAIPFLLAGIIPLVATSVSAKWISRLIAGTLLGLFLWVITLLPTIHDQGAIILNYPWVSTLNLSLELYLDGLSALFTLLITGIGAGVFLYAGYYMEGDDRAHRFLAQLSAFTGSMLGVVLAGNLLLLFICWELTSFFSYLLIGFNGKDPAARSAATQALVVTAGGGLALLVGLILLGLASGSASFTDVLQFRMQDHPWYAGVTLLIMLGSFTKSAQFPFHFWLPGGMTAPTPASAFLHSATMVKAGIYLLARLYPTLGNTNLWLGGLCRRRAADHADRRSNRLTPARSERLARLRDGQLARRAGADARTPPLRGLHGGTGRHHRARALQKPAVHGRRGDRSQRGHAHHRPTRRVGAKNARCAGDHGR